ncbi:MAG: hypothetical protein WKG07_30800 [Hymenobacter sp.]
MMAAADIFTIKVKGKSAHGAYPWQSVDPVVASAQIIMGLQTIVRPLGGASRMRPW